MKQEILDAIKEGLEKLEFNDRNTISFGKVNNTTDLCFVRHVIHEDRDVLIHIYGSISSEVEVKIFIPHTKTRESIVKGIEEIILK